MVTVVEDNSDNKHYKFKFRVEKATHEPFFMQEDGTFEISHVKEMDGIFSGMLQIYPEEAYYCTYKWFRKE